MAQSAEPYISYEEFLEAEVARPTRHEWLDGVVYAMGGGTLEHSRLAAAVTAAFHRSFAACRVLTSAAMIFVRETNLSTYADVVLVCGGTESQKVERNGKVIGEALINPTVIVEVLSDSTEKYDRGEKFSHYMRIHSLREYVLVAQNEMKIEVWKRPTRGHWLHHEAGRGESIEIHAHTFNVDDIYRLEDGTLPGYGAIAAS